jgi:hypothetical protein
MGCAFGLPDRHPNRYGWCDSCPRVRAGRCGCVWVRGAWWFENWIVDASEEHLFFALLDLTISTDLDFFRGRVDRFVIILV